jgi:hypothetical protein
MKRDDDARLGNIGMHSGGSFAKCHPATESATAYPIPTVFDGMSFDDMPGEAWFPWLLKVAVGSHELTSGLQVNGFRETTRLIWR